MANASKDSIDEYFRLYGPQVYRRALVLLGNSADAEDILQEVFLRVSTRLDQFRGDSSLSTWLYRITTNACLTLIRNRKRQGELLKENYLEREKATVGRDPSEALAIRELLARAEHQQANAAICIYVDGMTRPETAELLEVSLRTVGNLLNRFNEWAQNELTIPDSLSSETRLQLSSWLKQKANTQQESLPESAEPSVKAVGEK